MTMVGQQLNDEMRKAVGLDEEQRMDAMDDLHKQLGEELAKDFPDAPLKHKPHAAAGPKKPLERLEETAKQAHVLVADVGKLVTQLVGDKPEVANVSPPQSTTPTGALSRVAHLAGEIDAAHASIFRLLEQVRRQL